MLPYTHYLINACIVTYAHNSINVDSLIKCSTVLEKLLFITYVQNLTNASANATSLLNILLARASGEPLGCDPVSLAWHLSHTIRALDKEKRSCVNTTVCRFN